MSRALTLRIVSESPEQIRGHIAALTEFEGEFAEFVAALEKYRRTGEKTWPDEEYDARRRRSSKTRRAPTAR